MYVCAGWCLVGFISLILYGFFYLLEGVSMISMGTLTFLNYSLSSCIELCFCRFQFVQCLCLDVYIYLSCVTLIYCCVLLQSCTKRCE